VTNDPVNKNDPAGLDPEDAPRGLDPLTDYWYRRIFYPVHPAIILSPLEIVSSAMESAAERLQDRSTFSKKCRHGLKLLGTTPEALQQAAGDVQLRDGTRANIPISNLYEGDAAAAGRARQFRDDSDNADYLQENGLDHWRISDHFNTDAGLQAETRLGGSYALIYIAPSRINPSRRLDGLLWHEILHWVTGKVDPDIQGTLPGLKVNERDTSNIARWLTQNCINGEGNR
jgi:hypothetical protein